MSKVKDSKSIQQNALFIPLQKNQTLFYSLSQKPHKLQILKHDPFLSLYLVKSENSFEYPFKVNMNYTAPLAVVDSQKVSQGEIVSNQVGLNSLATFSQKTHTPAILTNSCGFLEGVVRTKGVIQKEYLKRFIQSSEVEYSDIGIRVKENGGRVVVSSFNPFVKQRDFQIGDTILELNGKKVKSAASFMREILFSKVSTTHKVKIERNGKVFYKELQSTHRYGGGDISDTYLEQKGVYFDKNMRVIKVEPKAKDLKVKIGDKLVQVNGVKIKNQQAVRKSISDYEEFTFLLFERRGFQFFVKIN